MDFFSELKRRNVFRVGAVYLAVSWLLTQIAGSLESAIGLPGWFDGMVVALLALGFPVAILLAWAFELTPDGLKRTAEVAAGDSIATKTGRRLDYVLLGAAALAIVVVAADRLAPRKDAPTAVASGSAPAGAVLDDKSIAVLPFVDLSPEGDQEYFADGLSEELLNVLAQSQDLRVAGRTSSFAYKGRNVDLREIGEALGVAHILEGSVRKSGQRIRVTAQLIKASDGYHIFSDSYDRNLADIFAVQDDIAGKIGETLMARLSGDTAQETAPAALEAYDLYLLARQRIYTRESAPMHEADELLDRALAIDPDYAPALAQKAILSLLLSSAGGAYGDRPIQESIAKAKEYIDRALAQAPDLAEGHAGQGLLLYHQNAPLEEIERPLKRALSINPSLSDAQLWLGNAANRHGEYDRALALYEALFERDPMFRPSFNTLVLNYILNRRFDDAERLIARVERISGEENQHTLMARGMVAAEQGQLADAVRRLRGAYELGGSSTVLRGSYALALLQIGEVEKTLEVAPPAIVMHALHAQGRTDEADALAQSLLPDLTSQPGYLGPIFFHYAMTGQHDKAAELVAAQGGSPEALAAQAPGGVLAWAPSLAHSWRALGRQEEFDETIRLLKEGVVAEREAGGNGFYYWHAAAELDALGGDDDGAIEKLRMLVENGYADIDGLFVPAFDTLRQDPRFQALETDVIDRANAERVKLGLAPLPQKSVR